MGRGAPTQRAQSQLARDVCRAGEDLAGVWDNLPGTGGHRGTPHLPLQLHSALRCGLGRVWDRWCPEQDPAGSCVSVPLPGFALAQHSLVGSCVFVMAGLECHELAH